MSETVRTSIKRSSADFADLVWPTVQAVFGGGNLLPVETVTANEFAAELDRTAGIDAWIVQRGKHVFGLASRVQWGVPSQWFPYNTFTVRTKLPSGGRTEYDKRRSQIATSGSIYARWTTQAYVSCACPSLPDHLDQVHTRSRKLITAAIVDTRDVIAAVDLGIGFEKPNPDGTRFWCVRWQELWERGCLSLHVLDAAGVHSRSEVA
jgi:hypothetical protein